MTTDLGRLLYICPHCGRKWHSKMRVTMTGEVVPTNVGAEKITGWTGFIVSATRSHTNRCKKRTPEERLRNAQVDQIRWRKNRPVHVVVLDTAEYGGGASNA